MTSLFRLALLALALLAPSAPAAIFSEGATDAGQTGPQARNILLPDPLTTITGTLEDEADIDLYRFRINDPSLFTARTIIGDLYFAPVATPVLYLFDTFGNAIYGDDLSGGSRQAHLGAGLPISPPSPGTYLLGITWSGNVPVDASGDLLFASFPTNYLNDQFQSYAPAAGAGRLAGWELGGVFAEDGPEYQIDITGASQIPEPGTVLLLSAGLGALAVLRRRR